MIKIKIDINTMKESIVIPNDKEEFAELWVHIVTNGFIFNEFSLIVEGMNQIYKVKIEGRDNEQKIYIKKIQNDDNGLLIKNMKYQINTYGYLTKLTGFINDINKKKTFKELYKENDDFLDVIVPMQFMHYLLRESKNRKIEYVISEKKEYKVSKKKTQSKKSKQKDKVYTLLDCIKIYQKNLNGEKRRYERHTAGWDVRGFWRHCKSGKVTWVNPSPRGENRKKENKTEREYKV